MQATPRTPPVVAATAIGVLVVDDQLAVREGVARLISCTSLALREVATAASGTEALAIATRMRPEAVVLDVDLAGEDGLTLIPLLCVTARVLVLSSHGDSATRSRATQLGARAFVEKHEPAAALLDALEAMVATHSREEESPAGQGTSSRGPVGSSSDAQPPSGF
ncbi:response regulator transcription factor [uncultured Piscinibacter sp.]|uniref:response regulator n=1 Tax=uncultured Piscinibacter sp. TaxID=1131835 RepID=UPI0026306FFB|nr:response regulator transcription factor [uncultured Piscinibacter sp.]